MNVRGSTPSSIRYAIGGRLGFLSKCQNTKEIKTQGNQKLSLSFFCLISPLQYCKAVSMAHFFSLSQWGRCEAAASLLCHKYTSRKLSSRNRAIKCHNAFRNQRHVLFSFNLNVIHTVFARTLKFFIQSICVCGVV